MSVSDRPKRFGTIFALGPFRGPRLSATADPLLAVSSGSPRPEPPHAATTTTARKSPPRSVTSVDIAQPPQGQAKGTHDSRSGPTLDPITRTEARRGQRSGPEHLGQQQSRLLPVAADCPRGQVQRDPG